LFFLCLSLSLQKIIDLIALKIISDDILITGLREGDLKSFECIYNQYYGLLCSFGMHLLNDSSAAEEIADDIFFHLWDRHSEIEISNLQGYLIRSVRNRCLTELKSARRRAEMSAEDPNIADALGFIQSVFADGSHPLGELLEKEFDEHLMRSIDSLPEECRKVFMMSVYQHKRNAEIARELGISVSTVKYHKHNAVVKISEQMSKYLLFVLSIMYVS